MSSVNTDDVAKTLEAIAKAIDRIAKEMTNYDDVFLKAEHISRLRYELIKLKLKSVKLITQNEYEKTRRFIHDASIISEIGEELYINNAMIKLHHAAPCSTGFITIHFVKFDDGIKIDTVKYRCENVEILLDASYVLYLRIELGLRELLRLPIYDTHIEDIDMSEVLTILFSKDLVNRIIEVLNAYAEHLRRAKPSIMKKLQSIEDGINAAISVVQAVIDAFNELTRKTEAIENL